MKKYCTQTRSRVMKATANSWKILPFPSEYETMKLDKTFTADELLKIEQGFIPSAMEEKWFIYCENNTMYMHRSWTGYCIYILKFNASGKITDAKVNRDKEQYTQADIAEDEALVLNIIDTTCR